ncbi:hypothetical protein ACROAH_15295 [Shewanella oncorhynchi]|uniref:hypothetical protein n=1 Tax=Shewanella oncorhynchi TaxID=2726434 RepID=UPI003D78FF4E
MEVATSFIQLDQPLMMPGTVRPLTELMANIDWPTGATCATQEEDGGIIFWKAPMENVMTARDDAEIRDALPSICFQGMVLCWYHSNKEDLPELACDWRTAVMTNPYIQVRP